MSTLVRGRVVRTDAKVCHVDVEGEVVLAAPRGILFDPAGEQKNPVAVGDWVELDRSGNPAGLERVLERTNWLSRTASSHDPREQVLAANVDQLFVIASVNKPGFSSNRTDRILAACEWGRIPARLVLNKIDLATDVELENLRSTYESIPIDVIETCATLGAADPGSETLRELMRGKVSIFYGASGAGKSTLLNALQPGLKLKVGKISRYWETGKHTTTFSQLYRLDMGGFVIDTPGIRVFRLFGVPPDQVRDLFPDFRPYQARCRFNGCSHDHEPDCAVFDAVEAGELAASRYATYVELLDEIRKTRPNADEDVGGDEA
jgi:ribosome biogenesis GTPase